MSGQVVSWRVMAGAPRAWGHGSDGWDDWARPGRTWPDAVSSPNKPAPIRASSLSWEDDPVISDLGYFPDRLLPLRRGAGLLVVQVRESRRSTIWT